MFHIFSVKRTLLKFPNIIEILAQSLIFRVIHNLANLLKCNNNTVKEKENGNIGVNFIS